MFDFCSIVFSGTFKVKKTVFQEEGYDLNRVTEPIYYLNQQKQIYERLTSEIYDLILKEKSQILNKIQRKHKLLISYLGFILFAFRPM